MSDSYTALDRVYERLLGLYPRAFREAYAAAMAETFERRRREAWAVHDGWPYRWWFFVREVLGLVAAALGQRLSGIRRHFGPARPTLPGPTNRPGRKEVMAGLTQDLRHAVRRLLGSPGFTTAAAITMGLGIGANAAIFSVVYGVVLRPLPYPHPEELVWLEHAAPGIGLSEGLNLTEGLYLFYREQSRTLQDVAIYHVNDFTLTGGGDPERVQVAPATFTLNDVLQVPPLMGRWIREDDIFTDQPGVAVLSYGLWQRRFGSDPGILGRGIEINGVPFEVVGVMPRGFAFPDPETQIWIPRVVQDRLGGFSEDGVARLKPGVSAADAQRDLTELLPGLPDRFPGGSARRVLEDAKLSPLVRPLRDHVVGSVAQTMWIVLGTVGFVLLIACANVANLFLVRAEAREREVAVRTALGATRGQVVRLFLTESAVLTFAGGALGLVLAYVGVRALVAAGPAMIPRLDEVAVSAPALGFTTVVCLAAALAFGGIAALRARPHVVSSLKEGGRAVTAGRRRFRARNVLVGAQIALALILLTGSGLMLRSFRHLQRVDPGFDAENVLTFEIGLPSAVYPDRARQAAFYEQLLDRLRGLPGVEGAGAVSCLPLSSWCGGDPVYERGVPPEPGVIPPIVAIRAVSPGYFATVGIPLLAGRLPERADHEQVTDAVLVSSRLVDLYWPDQDPIGKQISVGGPSDSSWLTIVGIVGDVQTGDLTDGPSPLLYYPLDRRPVSPMTFTVRTSTPPLTLADAVRHEVWSLDSDVPVAHVSTLEQLIAESAMAMTFTMFVLLIAAVVSLVLGAVGVYAVVSYVVGQRRNEIGVRLALGARAGDVRRMVLQQSGVVAAAGLATGLAGAFALTRLMDTLLFGVSPTDPITYGAVTVILLVVALVASYLPARRAARIDPVEALR